MGWPYPDGDINGVGGWVTTQGSWILDAGVLGWVSAVGSVNRVQKAVAPPVGARVLDAQIEMQFTASGNNVTLFWIFSNAGGSDVVTVTLSTTGAIWNAQVGNDNVTSPVAHFTHVPFRRDVVRVRADGHVISLTIAGVPIVTFDAPGFPVSEITRVDLKALVSTGVNKRFVAMSDLIVRWAP